MRKFTLLSRCSGTQTFFVIKRFLVISLLVSVLSLVTSSCDYVEDFMDYSKLTILDDGDLTSGELSGYKNLKVKIGDDEYTAFGTYKVPNNTKVSISWSYCETYYYINSWKNVWNNASVDLMVGEIEHVTVTLVEGSAKIDKEWGI